MLFVGQDIIWSCYTPTANHEPPHPNIQETMRGQRRIISLKFVGWGYENGTAFSVYISLSKF